MNVVMTAPVIGFIVASLTCGTSVAAPSPQSMREAEQEITRQSGLPQNELKRLLADCSHDQQSITVCAWRDQVAADTELTKTLAQATAQSAICGNTLARDASQWKHRRDTLCKEDAAREFSGGSNEAAAVSQCAASMTLDYTDKIQKSHPCAAQ